MQIIARIRVLIPLGARCSFPFIARIFVPRKRSQRHSRRQIRETSLKPAPGEIDPNFRRRGQQHRLPTMQIKLNWECRMLGEQARF